jgi:hypothetical protein
MFARAIRARHRVVVTVFAAREKSRNNREDDDRANAADEELAIPGVE